MPLEKLIIYAMGDRARARIGLCLASEDEHPSCGIDRIEMTGHLSRNWKDKERFLKSSFSL